jgi:hypothetical protein
VTQAFAASEAPSALCKLARLHTRTRHGLSSFPQAFSTGALHPPLAVRSRLWQLRCAARARACATSQPPRTHALRAARRRFHHPPPAPAGQRPPEHGPRPHRACGPRLGERQLRAYASAAAPLTLAWPLLLRECGRSPSGPRVRARLLRDGAHAVSSQTRASSLRLRVRGRVGVRRFAPDADPAAPHQPPAAPVSLHASLKSGHGA